MQYVRIIKTYDRKVGKLILKGRHEQNVRVPLVGFIPDMSDQEESPNILYGRDHDNYHLDTPENRKRLSMLEDIDAEIAVLKHEAKLIINGMTDPIYAGSYWEHLTGENDE